jgi:hypothetical protein
VSRSKKFGNVVASPREVDEANTWLRKHAEDIKGLDDAKHLRPSPAAPPSPPGDTTAADPTCDFCNSPIFEEYRDAKQPEYCTRPKCQKKRHKFDLQQEAAASGEFDLIRCVDDKEDEGADPFESSDAVTDAEELPRKVFAVEESSTENDLRTSSVAEDDEDDEDKDKDEEEFEDGDEPLDHEDEEPSGEEEEDESEENPEGTSTTKIKIERDRTKKIRSDGEGVVPVASDFSGDDEVPLLVRIRNGFRPPDKGTKPLLPGVEFFSTKRCHAHGIDACVKCFPVSNADIVERRKVIDALRDQEDAERYAALVEAGMVPEPPPKNELEAIEREAKRIEKERIEKEEMERRKIVKKRRIRPPRPKETPNLRLQYKFSTRQLADVMDIPLFNKQFPVRDRSLLYDSNPKTKTIYRKWYTQIAENAEERGVPISKGRRRGDSRYEDIRFEKVEFDIVEGKPVVVSAGYVAPEIVMIDGVAVSVDPVDVESLAPPAPPKTKTEFFPDGSTKVHVVKQLAMPDKIKSGTKPNRPKQYSPKTYGELINALPFRPETMLTIEERAFYRDYAARNLTAAQLMEKHGEKTDDDILLLENRAIRHAFKLRLLDPPWEALYREFELDLDEDYRLDALMVSKTGAGYIGGHVTGGKLDRYGRTMKLNSFRTRPIRESGGGSSTADNGAPDYDDFGDESAA